MKRSVRRGQSMVEMALLLPFLIAILMGIIDYGDYIFSNSAAQNAARRGSERASLAPPSTGNVSSASDHCVTDIRTEAKKNTFLFDLQDSNISIAYPSGMGRNIADDIQVTVDYTGNWLTPLGSLFARQSTFHLVYTSQRTIQNIDATYCP